MKYLEMVHSYILRAFVKLIVLFCSVQRLCEMLSCYRGGGDVTILGERYGYGYGKKETAAKGKRKLHTSIKPLYILKPNSFLRHNHKLPEPQI